MELTNTTTAPAVVHNPDMSQYSKLVQQFAGFKPVIEPGTEFRAAVEQFAAHLTERDRLHVEKDALKSKITGSGSGVVHDWQRVRYEAEFNRKYVRIWRHYGSGKSAYAFLDQEGNIFKPAGYQSPAKGVRGNIFNPAGCLLGTGLYGVDHLR